MEEEEGVTGALDRPVATSGEVTAVTPSRGAATAALDRGPAIRATPRAAQVRVKSNKRTRKNWRSRILIAYGIKKIVQEPQSASQTFVALYFPSTNSNGEDTNNDPLTCMLCRR